MKYLILLLTGTWLSLLLRQTEPVAPSVEIKGTADGHLVAIVKDHPSYDNTLFALQTLSELSNFKPVKISDATVEISDGCVRFSSAERAIVFKLIDKPCSLTGESKNLTAYAGYGLITQTDQEKYEAVVNFVGPVLPSIQDILKCKCTQNEPQLLKSCLAGGEGSAECSYGMEHKTTVLGMGSGVATRCKASCAQDYYACCYWEL